MKTKMTLVLMTAFLNAFILEGLESMFPDNELYIYGTITTVDNEQFTGQIRWGSEEAFWFDHFNSAKPKNEYVDMLSREDMRRLEEKEKDNCKSGGGWGNWSWGNSDTGDNTHLFSCEFGDIKEIIPRRGDRLTVVLQNGAEIDLDGGSNDVGAKVRIHDEELGTVKIEWDMIDKIEFKKGPASFSSAMGRPLYGMVETTEGNFTGFLQWDHDERLSLDELDGDTRNGDMSIEFGNIKSITSKRSGSEVELWSGRTMMLTGSNDVDDDNRGIIVNVPEMGRVDIPWESFITIEFAKEEEIPSSTYTYRSNIKSLAGSVVSVDGDTYSGKMVYDLDEALDNEILNGVSKDIEYFIPFRNIESIKPGNGRHSLVTLTNGERLRLSGKVDVTDENDGVMVLSGSDDYEYLLWSEIEEIKITDR